jgi:acetyl-CoA C-acetyltransferase
MAALLAELPLSVAGVTVNRLCASGLQALGDAYRALSVGEGEVVLAGGVESMSRAPFVMGKAESAFARAPELFDTTLGWRFINPKLAALHHPYSMGETAENVAERWGVTREEQDAFALASQQKYAAAEAGGRFAAERVPVPVPQKKGEPLHFNVDEQARPNTTLADLAKLKPAFRSGGTVTAGNAAGLNDGAAMLLVASEQAVNDMGLKPLARIAAFAVAGVDPAIMGVGPIPAVQKLLKRAGLRIADIGLVELNEAFAAQGIPCIRDLEIDPSIVNVNGGSIAMGHPLGCSGARITTTLVHELQRRPNVRYGVATMCIGVGQGAALLVENMAPNS